MWINAILVLRRATAAEKSGSMKRNLCASGAIAGNISQCGIVIPSDLDEPREALRGQIGNFCLSLARYFTNVRRNPTRIFLGRPGLNTLPV
jgi:hypothetical protein